MCRKDMHNCRNCTNNRQTCTLRRLHALLCHHCLASLTNNCIEHNKHRNLIQSDNQIKLPIELNCTYQLSLGNLYELHQCLHIDGNKKHLYKQLTIQQKAKPSS